MNCVAPDTSVHAGANRRSPLEMRARHPIFRLSAPRVICWRMAWLPSTLVSDNGCLMHLLERRHQLEALNRCFQEARATCGKLVLVAGEARLLR